LVSEPFQRLIDTGTFATQICRCYGANGEGMAPSALFNGYRWSSPMSQHCHFQASRSLTALEQGSTIIAVIEMSQSKWLVAALVTGVERQPLKKLDVQEEALLKLLHRWRNEAGQAGREIKRIVVAYEAGRDGFWLTLRLWARDVEAYVIHPTSIAVSREHRRAKTDRLDTELLMRAVLGWLRGEMRHCSMVAIPTIEEEDASRPNRERQNLVTEQMRIVNQMKAIRTLQHSHLPADPAQSRGKAQRPAHGGRDSVAGEHAQNCAAISRGCAWCASRSARSSRSACASSRRLLLQRKARTRWFASLSPRGRH
jgi:hypothetical protein